MNLIRMDKTDYKIILRFDDIETCEEFAELINKRLDKIEKK